MSKSIRARLLTLDAPHNQGADGVIISTPEPSISLGRHGRKILTVASDRVDVTEPLYVQGTRTMTQSDLAEFETETEGTTATEGSLLTAGSSFSSQASPFPVAFVDRRARVISRNLWDDDPDVRGSIMGFQADGKSATHNHGLCPAGHVDHGGQFLRKDGIWATPATAQVGTVADHITQLHDVSSSYTPDGVLTAQYDASFPQGIGYKPVRDLNLATIQCSGDIYANSFISRSDERLKDDIKPADDCLAKVQSLSPVQYVFKDDDTKRLHTGLLAQEVRDSSMMPEIALGEESRETMAVDYGSIISTLVGAVKTLADRVSNSENVGANSTTKTPTDPDNGNSSAPHNKPPL